MRKFLSDLGTALIYACLWVIAFRFILSGVDIQSELKTALGIIFYWIYDKLDDIYRELKSIRKQGERTINVSFNDEPLKLHSLQPEIDALNKQSVAAEKMATEFKDSLAKIKKGTNK